MGTTKALRREALRKIRQVGLWGFVQHAVAKLVREGRRLLLNPIAPQDSFDLLYGTDTGGLLGVGSLDIPDHQMEHAVQYRAISDDEFTRVIKELPISANELTFLDLGSGKGRALLLASRLPFRRIVGVELSRMLHNIALRNIKTFRDEAQQAPGYPINPCECFNVPDPAGAFTVFLVSPH